MACTNSRTSSPSTSPRSSRSYRASSPPPTVKQHLAALRMLFGWLVTGHVIETNPAHSVRGPRYVVTKGKTPVLAADEARAVLDAIDTGTLTGLRDRALIGVMIYSFARVNAVIGMKVKDYFSQRTARLGATARERRQGARSPLSPHPGEAPRRIYRRRRRPRTARCSARPAARPARHGRCGNRTCTG
jgi:integrase